MFKCVNEKRLRLTVAMNSLPSWQWTSWYNWSGLTEKILPQSLTFLPSPKSNGGFFPFHQGADQSGMNLNAWNTLNPPSYMHCIWFSLNMLSLYFLASLQSVPSTLLMQYLVSGKPAWQFAWAEKICLKSAFTGSFNILRKMLCFCSLKVCHKHE